MIFFFNTPQPHGGPGSFHERLVNYLKLYYIDYTYDLLPTSDIKSALIINGTNRFAAAILLKLTKKRLVFRVDGRSFSSCSAHSLAFALRALYFDLSTIFFLTLSDHIVFQSDFIKSQWDFLSFLFERKYSVIYNPTPSNISQYQRVNNDSCSDLNLVSIEGSLQGTFADKFFNCYPSYSHLVQIGDISNGNLRNRISQINNVTSLGRMPRDHVLELLVNNKWIYICLEDNPPCPNSVIEALWAGNPIVGLSEGSLPLIVGNAGILLSPAIRYATTKDFIQTITSALDTIKNNYDLYSDSARQRAKLFDPSLVFKSYLSLLQPSS